MRSARRRRRSMRPASAAALSASLAVPERVRAPRFEPSIHEKHRVGLSPVHTQAASQLREAEPRLGCEHKGRYHVPPHETLVQQRMIHRSIAKAPGGVLKEDRVGRGKPPSTLELSRLFFNGSEWFRPGGYISATPAATPVKIGDDTEGGMDPTLSEPRRRCEHIAGTALQIPLKQAWSASADGGDLTPPK